MLRSDRVAKAAVVIGALMMIGAAVSCIEEGGGPFVSHGHRVIAKRVVWFGASIAVFVPAIITGMHYWTMKPPHSREPPK